MTTSRLPIPAIISVTIYASTFIRAAVPIILAVAIVVIIAMTMNPGVETDTTWADVYALGKCRGSNKKTRTDETGGENSLHFVSSVGL